MSEKAVGWNTMTPGVSTRKGSNKTGEFLSKNIGWLASVALQLAILYFILNPVNLLNQLDAVSTINEIGKVVSLPPNEIPVVARVGDMKNLAKVDDLKKGNAIDAEIYKDAQDRDYVLGYTNKLVIYRKEGKKVIYDGNTAQQKLAKSQSDLVSLVVTKAKSAKVIPDSYASTPQVSVVTDPDAVKKINEFYSVVQKDDLVAQFSAPDMIVIYRPSSDTIIKSGTFALAIK